MCTIESATLILAEPTKTGYTFNGWYDNASFTDEAITTITSGSTGNVTLYAKWTSNSYTITLDVNGGSMIEPIVLEATYDELYTLSVPTPPDVSPFTGWYLDGVKYTDENGLMLDVFNETNDITLTAAYYYEVSIAEDLNNVRNNLAATYYLINDIDISGIEWVPIGDDENPFTGIFDGKGNSIIGLTITTPHDYLGLFGYNEGTITNTNFNLVNINVTGNIGQVIYGGSIIGYNNGYVNFISVLDGDLYLKISGGANGYLGGIVGIDVSQSNDNIVNLESNINIIGDLTSYTGGVIGYIMNSKTLSNIVNSGKVESTGNYVGGVVAYSNSSTTIINSHNNGDISGYDYIGGLFGYGNGISTNNSYNIGYISGHSKVGGLFGLSYYLSTSIIENSYNSGQITGYNGVGGILEKLE